MQYSQEHLKTMVYAEFGGQTECIMGNWKIENKSKIPIQTKARPLKPLSYTCMLYSVVIAPILSWSL